MPEVNTDDNVEVEEEEATEELPEGLEDSAMEFVMDILTGNWKTWELDEQLAFRERLSNYFQAASTLRTKFDAQVWAGHDDGTINLKVESLRARRTVTEGSNKGGRKAAPKTIAQQLLRKG